MFSQQKKYMAFFGVLLASVFVTDLHAAIKYGPRISQVTRDSAVITWTTDNDSVDNKVFWGPASGLTNEPVPELTNEKVQDETSYDELFGLWNHVAYLTGLSTRTEYSYKVSSDGEESPVYNFLTAVAPGEPFKFGFVSDFHNVTSIGARQLEHAIQSGIDFWIHAGDTVHNGEHLSDWEKYFKVYNTFPNPYGVSKNFWASHAVYDTFSGHNAGYPPPYDGTDPWVFFYTFPDNGLPWSSDFYDPDLYRKEFTYGFGYGNVYFISLAAEKHVSGVAYEEQVQWLADQLQYSIDQGYDFRVVYSHIMGYTIAGTASQRFQQNIQPLLEQYNVTMHFGGHHHAYNRCTKNGVSHITIGTGGGSRDNSDATERPENETKYGCWVDKTFDGYAHAEVTVSGDTMTMEVIGTDEPRDVIDTVTWTASPVSTPEPAMVHQWKLDENSGTFAADAVGNLDGTLLNGTAWADGRVGSGIALDGIDDRVEIPGLDPPRTGTVEFWVRVDGMPSSVERILGGTDSFEVRLLTTGHLAADIFQGGSTVLKSATALSPGSWHHIAITWKANSSTEVYLDGKLDASGVYASSDPGFFTFSLGTRTGKKDYFAGRLDEVAIYNYPLSAAEVEDHFNTPPSEDIDECNDPEVVPADESRDMTDNMTSFAPPAASALLHQWSLDENVGIFTADAVGNLNGTLLNGTAWVDGLVGSGIALDGFDDSVEIPGLEPPSTGTLEFWMHFDGTPTSYERILGGTESFEVRLLTTGHLAADIFQRGSAVLKSASALSPGSWHHVVITWKAKSSTEIYLDGNLDASGVFASSDPGSFTLSLGTRTGKKEYYAGRLDEVAIYNYQLSAAEVLDRFNSASGGGCE
ncbi:MAG: LamG-like jellyroll fold domain-containing protein [Pseudomonadota bacterium]